MAGAFDALRRDLVREIGPQSAAPLNVPAAIRDAVDADLEYAETEPIEGMAVDLNRDGIRDYLLRSAPSRFAETLRGVPIWRPRP